MQVPSYIDSLLQKRLERTLDPEEEIVLEEWIGSASEWPFPSSVEEEEAKERIWSRISKTRTTIPHAHPTMSSAHPWSPLLKAAAVFLLVSLSARLLYLAVYHTPGSPQTLVSRSTPARKPVPGGRKAILTLADGKKIALDSATDGAIIPQNNMRVLPMAGGRLKYEKDAPVAGRIPMQYNQVTTPRGGQFEIRLSDGTGVWLNSASSIRFPTDFQDSIREVEVTGEVYFEVASRYDKTGKKQPFIVHVANPVLSRRLDIRVVGTAFDINDYTDEDQSSVTLLQGCIHLTRGHSDTPMRPGQQAVTGTGKGKDSSIVIQDDADVSKAIAWKKGMFEFDDMELPVILRQISRWYDIGVLYEDSIPHERFGGSISKKAPLTDVLHMLEQYGMKFTIEGGKLRVKLPG